MVLLKEGNSRKLTSGEILLAKKVFSEGIRYEQVRVFNDSYLPWGMQSREVAMTPNGNLYFRQPHYSDDFSKEYGRIQHWFIHEMVHVLQHQIGMNVRMRGAFSWIASYNYSLPPYKKLSDFNMEQQASIISDYFCLTHLGLSEFKVISTFRGIIGPDIKDKYKSVLEIFLAKPNDKKAFL
ncbi:hypothetical protein [Mixta sp. Marseille-Q2659]|uniref:hypothetical protein n=1 Tax=Mixta sp. Marseille-Q2659 TaxID=2736607 RepID=UPI0023B90ED4|nr:hypothetical protein [Mixta sp. Marseille-Q2659]